MAKKKRTAKRSTKASTRPPTTKRVAAKGKGVAFQTGAFQGLPPSVSQRKLGPAVQSPQGVIEPPHAPIEGRLDIREQADSLIAEGVVIPPPVPITPTNYPDSPQGTVNVQNHITINIQSEEFSRFNKNIEALIGELRLSNEISGEVRDQLVSELRAGRELINAPKPQRDLIDLLLVKPLKWVAEKSGSAIIGKLAKDALEWLLRMLCS